jgi:hypothetical protein
MTVASRLCSIWLSTSKPSPFTATYSKLLKQPRYSSTSDQHKWFQESRSSKENPKRDWYIWRKPSGWDENGKPIPPCNWRAAFGGSVWEWDEPSQEYYLHLFAVEQPDLVCSSKGNRVKRSLIVMPTSRIGNWKKSDKLSTKKLSCSGSSEVSTASGMSSTRRNHDQR